jgi:hypothetical protein
MYTQFLYDKSLIMNPGGNRSFGVTCVDRKNKTPQQKEKKMNQKKR